MFFDDPADVGNLISGSSAFSKTSLNIWKFTVHLLLKLKLRYFGTSCEELTHWKRPWCWEGLEAGGEGDNRGLDGWITSPTQWTWVWVNSRSWWWTGRLWFLGSQRVRHNLTTELNWTESNKYFWDVIWASNVVIKWLIIITAETSWMLPLCLALI